MYVTTRLYELIRGDPEPILDVERKAAERDLVQFKPPSLSLAKTITYPM